jgi:hypothetical protein
MITKTLRKTPDIYPLHSIRVIDGDTIEAMICLPFDTKISKRIRLKGWWADETEGIYRSNGMLAQHLLEVFCAGKALWLHAPSCRLDKYGRVIGHLMHGERIIAPREVLGSCQLTEGEHKLRRDQTAAARKLGKVASEALNRVDTADTQSKCPIDDSRAKSAWGEICGYDSPSFNG